MIPGVLEVVSIGLVISACLAIFLDEAIYAVAALAGTFLLTSLLYALTGAPYVAIFQFAVGIGTIAILFLSGEMLSEKPVAKTSSTKALTVAVTGFVLSLPAILFSLSSPNSVAYDVSFGEALWDLRGVDVVLQGLVVLTLAVGMVIVLYTRKHKNSGSDEQ
ncbi:MAG: NADH-quinone oxidoreductase subunit J [Candidatus Bathyarchaeota archaeon]|nr:NADH-quinone oxidoreductase subunit J [Candidatus Bathyarchaeota archaeon]